ncbi:MAG: DUF1847 domain-containing protein [Deltaproteobacteria bacterium]|nr:DUF1847 domain-containing protein [Deltaproteobacteria bacterium]MBW1922918.1 DUF1847 domain-containing protein [Deltaproteobacteria bacterium]MBW1949245.1 DUF1847 domain-containing protein [Deltaproteobacteria bacterium]MBW2101462.1 DUF1847 domain-containing protein [Deltaproteobacteria bacterium]MBW2346982.1 DUF1847 domain-containing protein [Deltaproteobacteria bacterium]
MGDDKKGIMPSCATCEVEPRGRICYTEEGKASKGCPTLGRVEVLAEAEREYEDEEVREFARQASIQEAECYANRHERPYVLQPTKTRIVEICEFAKRMHYKRLGLAFCIGLVKEARVVTEIFQNHGFEVVSVLCKAGRTPKAAIGIRDEEKIFQGTDETMCNPIFQAKLLNHEKTDFNVLLGLCVGHDSLFFRYAEAPVTVLAAKDRVTGHNPLAAVYLSDSYYRKITVP